MNKNIDISRFFQLLESSLGDVKPLLNEQNKPNSEWKPNLYTVKPDSKSPQTVTTYSDANVDTEAMEWCSKNNVNQKDCNDVFCQKNPTKCKFVTKGFFEGLREFLLSPVGVGTGILVSFTGVGTISTVIAWGLLLIYDAFEFYSGNGNWLNIIIDVIALSTAGQGGGILGSLISKLGSSTGLGLSKLLTNTLEFLKKSEVGYYIIESISVGLGAIKTILAEALSIMKTKLSVKWAESVFQKANEFVTKIVEWFKSVPSKIKGSTIVSSLTKNGTIQKFGNIVFGGPQKWSQSLIQGIEKLTQKQMSEAVSGFIEKTTVKLAEKETEDLRNNTIEDVLSTIDNKFGSNVAKLFMVYIYAKKFGKEVTNISTGKSADKVQYTTDALRGNPFLDKLGEYSNKLSKELGVAF